jgi:hypothetical protein
MMASNPLREFQKNNSPVSTLAKVVLRQAQDDFSLDTDPDLGRF